MLAGLEYSETQCCLCQINPEHSQGLVWTFRISSGVSKRIYKSVVQGDRKFLRIGAGCRRTLRRQPQVAPHQGNGLHEGRRRLVIPSGLALGHGVSFLQRVGGQSDPGEDSQQDGRGAGDGQVGPLALGFHAQVGPHLLKEPAPVLDTG